MKRSVLVGSKQKICTVDDRSGEIAGSCRRGNVAGVIVCNVGISWLLQLTEWKHAKSPNKITPNAVRMAYMWCRLGAWGIRGIKRKWTNIKTTPYTITFPVCLSFTNCIGSFCPYFAPIGNTFTTGVKHVKKHYPGLYQLSVREEIYLDHMLDLFWLMLAFFAPYIYKWATNML